MKILISGGTGLIGGALTDLLLSEGHEVSILSRSTTDDRIPAHAKLVHWDAETIGNWTESIETSDAVVHLAGESIGSKRWTPEQKKRILNSRVTSGEVLTKAIHQAKNKPSVFIQASGIGIYGTSQRKTFDENSAAGDDYLASLATKWENASQPVEDDQVRRVIIRTGVVLDKKEGALARMLLPFRFFVGGPIGSGKQWISWIHLDDEVQAIAFLINVSDASGVFNLTAPNPVTNAEFGKTLGHVLNRPYWIPVPGFALKAALGEMSMLVLEGQKVLPMRLLDYGFNFQYADLKSALTDILNS